MRLLYYTIVHRAIYIIFYATVELKTVFYLFKFTEPITEIHGGPDLFINKDSTINLTCVVKFAPEPPPAMVWSHNREVKKLLSPFYSFYSIAIIFTRYIK